MSRLSEASARQNRERRMPEMRALLRFPGVRPAFPLTSDPAYLEPYEAISRIDGDLANLAALLATDPSAPVVASAGEPRHAD